MAGSRVKRKVLVERLAWKGKTSKTKLDGVKKLSGKTSEAKSE